MLAEFQRLYPNGSIISELIQIFQGKYIVRVSIQLEGITRATAMAAADTVEIAEDQARNRAFMVLGIKEIQEESAAFKPPQSVNISSHAVMTNISNANNNYTGSEKLAIAPLSENIASPIIKPEPPLPEPPLPEPEYQPPSNVTPFTPRSYTPTEDINQSSITKRNKKNQPINLSDVIAQTDVEIERLGWNQEQGKDYLIKTYGKRGRSLLSEDELRDFLTYLKSQPDPIAGF